MKEDLKPNEVMLLKKLDDEEWKETGEVFDEEVSEKMGREWMRRLLSGMTGDNPGIVDCKGQKPKHWRINSKGKEVLQRNDPSVKDYEDGINYGEKVKLWEEYFAEINDLPLQLAQEQVAVLDWEQLEKFNIELADELVKNYESTMDALKEAIKDNQHTSNQEVETSFIRIENYDFSTEEDEDSIPVSQLRSRHLDQLIKVEGQAETVTQIKPEIVSAIFECSQCGDRYKKEQDSTEVKSPYKCDCGSRKFEIEEKLMQDSMMFRMKTKTAEGGKGEVRCIIRGEALEELHTLQKNVGKNVKVTGVLKETPIEKNSRRYDFMLEVNNVEYSSDNWELEPLTSQKKQELRELRDEYGWTEWLESLCSSFAPHILYREPIKMTALFLLLGRNDVEPENSNANFLIVGDPGVGKSDTFEWAEEEMPKIRMGDGQSSSEVGLTATAVKDELTGDWQAQAGLLPKMHNGFVAIDEFDKMDDDDYDGLQSIMESQKFRLNKANVDQVVPADVGIAALANPTMGSIDPYEPKMQQIPIPGEKDATLNRFAYVLFVEGGFDDEEKDKEINKSVLLQGEPEGSLEDEKDVIEPEFGVETMREIIQYGQSIEPRLTKETLNELDGFHRKHSRMMNENSEGSTISNKRQLKGMKQVCRAFARMDFSETIEMRHVEEMKSFYKVLGQRSAPDYDMEESDLSAFVGSFPQTKESYNKQKRQRFEKLISELGGDSDPVDVQEVIDVMTDRIDESDEYIEKVLDSMKDEGEAFEPESGKIQLL